MALRIPDSHKRSLTKLAALSKEQVQQLAVAIKGAQPTISARQLAAKISPSVEIPLSDLTGLMLVLLSLVLAQIGRTPRLTEEIADDVAFEAAAQGLLAGDDPERSKAVLRAHLVELLTVAGSLEITARAAEVYFAHETLFRSARVLSDIRPIFPVGTTEAPAAGMIVHNLELAAFVRGKEEKRFVAMNIHDLRELKAVIERALAKDASLQQLIAKSGITYIEDLPNEHQR